LFTIRQGFVAQHRILARIEERKTVSQRGATAVMSTEKL